MFRTTIDDVLQVLTISLPKEFVIPLILLHFQVPIVLFKLHLNLHFTQTKD